MPFIKDEYSANSTFPCLYKALCFIGVYVVFRNKRSVDLMMSEMSYSHFSLKESQ